MAKIARIALTDEEMKELLPQFNEILGLLERVRELPLEDESGVIATDNRNEFKGDDAAPFEDPDAIVEQFPRRKGRYAKVPPNL